MLLLLEGCKKGGVQEEAYDSEKELEKRKIPKGRVHASDGFDKKQEAEFLGLLKEETGSPEAVEMVKVLWHRRRGASFQRHREETFCLRILQIGGCRKTSLTSILENSAND